MKPAIPTSRPWWLNKYTAWYLAGVAGLVAGGVVLIYAPEFAVLLLEVMP